MRSIIKNQDCANGTDFLIDDKEIKNLLNEKYKKLLNKKNRHFERLAENFKNEMPNLYEKIKNQNSAKNSFTKKSYNRKDEAGNSLPKISKQDRINDVKIQRITISQFKQLRNLFLSRRIKSMVLPQICFGLFSGGKIFGSFGFASDYILRAPLEIEKPTIYLMSDFAISPTCENKLSKLVLYCILSSEVKLLAERFLNKEVKTVYTNVFTNKNCSVKYRGLFDLYIKKENSLGYGSQMGRWSLKEGFEKWKRKYQDLTQMI